MFGMSAKVEPQFQKVEKAAERSIIQNIRHAAFAIRKSIRESIKKSPEASSPGDPVTTRGRKGNVKNAIFASIEKESAIIGPRYSFVGDAMHAHEFGGSRGTDVYPARPTAGPGLEANTDRFAGSFRGSIGG